MNSEKSLIEVVAPLPQAHHEHLDSLNIGDKATRTPFIYRHVETGEEYVYLAGAIAWSGNERPGFILVLGVTGYGNLKMTHRGNVKMTHPGTS